MNAPMRLLLADHPATRAGIRIALAGRADVCAEVGDAEAATRAAEREQPDACLLSRDIPGDWVAAVRGIGAVAPHAAVVVLSELGEAAELLTAVRAGAVGYVPGTLDANRVQRIIAAIAAGEAVVPRAMVADLLLALRVGGGAANGLTARESQVLAMLRRGSTTAAIATQLGIAPVTVRRHISGLVQKLGVEDRAALANAGSQSEGGRRE